MWLSNNNIHASETSWAGTDFDMIINNNGKIEDLYTQIRSLVQGPQHAKEVAIYKPLADSLGI
jgi:hypothetical protein